MIEFINNVRHYIQGNIRYFLYNNIPFLLHKHIIEQYEYRVKVMNKECYDEGVCQECGCMTTNLQFANKSCDGNCYPPVLNIRNWEKYKRGHFISVNGDIWGQVFYGHNDSVCIYKNGALVNRVKNKNNVGQY